MSDVDLLSEALADAVRKIYPADEVAPRLAKKLAHVDDAALVEALIFEMTAIIKGLWPDLPIHLVHNVAERLGVPI